MVQNKILCAYVLYEDRHCVGIHTYIYILGLGFVPPDHSHIAKWLYLIHSRPMSAVR